MIEKNEPRLISATEKVDDIDNKLRPTSLDDYIGQSRIKENLKIFIQAAKQRGEAMDHVLLAGLPGLGKTTLANIIAQEAGVNIRTTSGPAIDKAGDLAAILTNLKPNDVLFIDEIHRLHRSVEEVLYPAMEDFFIDIVIGKGPTARSVKLDIPKFTLIGATTKMNLLSAPLRDRFGNLYKLTYYENDELTHIVKRSSQILETPIDEQAAIEVAMRARKTPRIANRLLKRVRDFAQVKGDGIINIELAREALALLDIDDHGLDEVDRKVLETIIYKYSGGPVGLQTLAASCAEDIQTLETVIEPYLLQIGFIEKTPQGRKATPHAYKHLNIS
jgi:Holliday junction DNA helicase RuvB